MGGSGSGRPLVGQPTERIVVAEGDDVMRRDLSDTLRAEGFARIVSVNDAISAVAVAVAISVCLVLVAIDLPGGGLRVAAQLAQNDNAPLVVMLTDDEADDECFSALRAGASGYLRKGLDGSHLASALRGALAGEAALSRTLAASVVAEFRKRDRRHLMGEAEPLGARLTAREWEVLELLEQGLPTADIAQHLYVAKVTVRTHVASIVRKLDVPDRDAAVMLLRTGSYV